jgi:hypothetical protein
MSSESIRRQDANESVGRDVATQVESVIARELGINPEETS